MPQEEKKKVEKVASIDDIMIDLTEEEKDEFYLSTIPEYIEELYVCKSDSLEHGA